MSNSRVLSFSLPPSPFLPLFVFISPAFSLLFSLWFWATNGRCQFLKQEEKCGQPIAVFCQVDHRLRKAALQREEMEGDIQGRRHPTAAGQRACPKCQLSLTLDVMIQEQVPIRATLWTAPISSPGFYSSFTLLSVVDIGVKYIFIFCHDYPAVRKETTRLASKMAWMHWRDYTKWNSNKIDTKKLHLGEEK